MSWRRFGKDVPIAIGGAERQSMRRSDDAQFKRTTV
jgi:hypothetical protein